MVALDIFGGNCTGCMAYDLFEEEVTRNDGLVFVLEKVNLIRRFNTCFKRNLRFC